MLLRQVRYLNVQAVKRGRSLFSVHHCPYARHFERHRDLRRGYPHETTTGDRRFSQSAAGLEGGDHLVAKSPARRKVQSKVVSATLAKLVEDVHTSGTPALHAFELANYVKRALQSEGGILFAQVYDLKPALNALRLVIAQDGSHSTIRTELKHVELLLSKQLSQYREDLEADLQRRLTASNVVLTDAEMAARLRENTIEAAWTDLEVGPSLEVTAEELVSYRQPSVEDVKAGVVALLQQESRHSRASHKFYNALLQVVTRNLPLCVEKPSRTKRLLKIDLDELRLRWENLTMTDTAAKDAGLAVNNSFPTSQPTTGLGLFKKIWSRMRSRLSPTSRSFAIALSLETRLATWRVGALRLARQLTTYEDHSSEMRTESVSKQKLLQKRLNALNMHPWQPVRDLCRAINLTEGLKTQHLNSVIEGALRYEPLHGEAASSETRWPKAQYVMDAFHLLHWKARKAHARVSDWHSEASSTTATDELFGVSPADLNDDVSADRMTYHVVMKGLVSRGDLRGALDVFEKMTDVRMEDFAASNGWEQGGYEYPSARTFEAFFYGFARYGIPSVLIRLDETNINSSEWAASEDDAAIYDDEPPAWTIEMLQVIIEAFLSIRYDKLVRMRDEDPFDEEEGGRVPQFDLQSSYKPHGRSPSPQGLFDILTALRRVSSDQADWVLYNFERIEKKFGSAREPGETRSGNSLQEPEGWTGWRLNQRVLRSLRLMKDMRST